MTDEIDRREFLGLAGRAAAMGFATSFAGCTAVAGPKGDSSTKPKRGKGKSRKLTALVYDPVFKKHDTGRGHPESPARLDAITRALADKRFKGRLLPLKPREATRERIVTCHAGEYYKLVKDRVAAGKSGLGFADTPVGKDSFAAAVKAVGAGLVAVDAVFEGKAKNAFCAVRPPGHHALKAKGMGFCIFSNLALAAKYAQAKHKIKRVLIADWDVHHGNGTQEMFYQDNSVFFFSTHQSDWYPFTGPATDTGKGKGKGFTLNCPLPAGSGRKQIVGAFKDKLVPAADKFKPELVLISAGFDSRKGDRLGRFVLTDADFAELTGIMLDIAKRHAGGRLVSMLEGGYNLKGLASATAAHVDALAGA